MLITLLGIKSVFMLISFLKPFVNHVYYVDKVVDNVDRS